MKRKSLLFFALMIAMMFAYAQQKPNYELAARFGPKQLDKMVFSTSVSPHWLKNTNQFWYKYKTTNGEQYYLVDPVRKSKTLLFDPVQMAADMSRLTLDPSIN